MKLTVVGIGMGNPDTMTVRAYEEISKADVIFGATRIIEAVAPFAKNAKLIESYKTEDIVKALKNGDYSCAVVAVSGDAGFYSVSKSLLQSVEPSWNVEVVAGISSIQYLAAKLFTSWEDAVSISGHGRTLSILPYIKKHKKVFLLTDAVNTPNAICKTISDAGYGDVTVSVGEFLSYPSEKITIDKADVIKDMNFSSLTAMMIENDKSPILSDQTIGLRDECFVRTDIPMTKAEIRAIVISKLKLNNAKVAFDIGSGTGSVSIEMALNMEFGTVYAIEQNDAAFTLTARNIELFKLYNITQIKGIAPDALKGLPIPDVAFLGGTRDKADNILKMLKLLNPKIRIVLTAVTLETATDGIKTFKKLGLVDVEIIQISVARMKAVGEKHMFYANNPIFILSGGGNIG